MNKEVRRALAQRNMGEFAYMMVFVYVGIAIGIVVWAAMNFSAAQDRAAARGYQQGYAAGELKAMKKQTEDLKRLLEKMKEAGWSAI